ncbi:MAG: hypothetical protein ACRDT4_26010 [Micromonosporaceae bacterium]
MGSLRDGDRQSRYESRKVTVEIDGLSGFAKNVDDDLTYYTKLQSKATQVFTRPALGFSGESCIELSYAAQMYGQHLGYLYDMTMDLHAGYLSLSSAAMAASVRYGDTDGGNARQLAELFDPAPGTGVVPPRGAHGGGSAPVPGSGGDTSKGAGRDTSGPPSAHEARMARLRAAEGVDDTGGRAPEGTTAGVTGDGTPGGRDHTDAPGPVKVGDVTVQPDAVAPHVSAPSPPPRTPMPEAP